MRPKYYSSINKYEHALPEMQVPPLSGISYLTITIKIIYR